MLIKFIFEAGDEDVTDTGGPKAKGVESSDGFPPTFTEKPKIVPNESGTLVTMRFRVRSKPKAEMQWYKGNQKIQESQKFKTKYIELGKDEYEVVLEISVTIYPEFFAWELKMLIVFRSLFFISFSHFNKYALE